MSLGGAESGGGRIATSRQTACPSFPAQTVTPLPRGPAITAEALAEADKDLAERELLGIVVQLCPKSFPPVPAFARFASFAVAPILTPLIAPLCLTRCPFQTLAF